VSTTQATRIENVVRIRLLAIESESFDAISAVRVFWRSAAALATSCG
jgi:hypothetical protein